MYALRSRGGKGLQVSKDVSDKFSSFVESSTSNVAKKLNRKRKLEVKIECPTEFEDESKEKLARNNVPDPKWIPMHWRAQLENIKAMRSSRDAPVDTVGCSMLADKDVLPEVHRYQVLISLMLSSQTKDQVVAEAMGKLKDHGLSIETVRETPLKDIEQMIYPVGFWKRKAVYIKNTTELLAKNYNGDIPSTLEELVKLPGVGPKMAHLCMDVAWGNVTGIGVDTHVHRISNRLGWTKKRTKEPEDTRKALEKWLPKEYWSDINWLMVGFGQQQCQPVNPKCQDCLNKDICPAAKRNGKY